MNFSQRLTRYLVGIFIGVLVSFAIFGKRSCTGWLPGNRVKETVFEKNIRLDDEAKCHMECYGLTRDEVLDLIRAGDVVFAESDTKSEVKEYLIEADYQGRYDVRVALRDSASVITSLKKPQGEDCPC